MHLNKFIKCSISHVNMFEFAHVFSNINYNFVGWVSIVAKRLMLMIAFMATILMSRSDLGGHILQHDVSCWGISPCDHPVA